MEQRCHRASCLQAGVVVDQVQLVGSQVGDHVHFTRAQRGHPADRFGNTRGDHPLIGGRLAPEVVEAFVDDTLSRYEFGDPVGAGSHRCETECLVVRHFIDLGVTGEAPQVILGHDHGLLHRQQRLEDRLRLGRVDTYLALFGGFGAGKIAKAVALAYQVRWIGW